MATLEGFPTMSGLPSGQCCRTNRAALAANYLAFIQLASIRLWLTRSSQTGVPQNDANFGIGAPEPKNVLSLQQVLKNTGEQLGFDCFFIAN